jgi:hypothetical protein
MNSLNDRKLAGKAPLSSRVVTAYRNVDMLALQTGQQHHGLDNFSLGSLPGVKATGGTLAPLAPLSPRSTTKEDLATTRDLICLYWMRDVSAVFPAAGLLSISELLRTL